MGVLPSRKIAAVCILVAGIIVISGIFLFGRGPGTGMPEPVHVHILAVNDFHGHLYEGQQLNNRSAGSAPFLPRT